MEALFTSLVNQVGTIPVIIIVMYVFRYSAMLLGWVAEKTEAKWDNKLAKILAKVADLIAWVIGNFGVGSMPKTVKYKPKVPKKIAGKLKFKKVA